jgi:hypothetical protein
LLGREGKQISFINGFLNKAKADLFKDTSWNLNIGKLALLLAIVNLRIKIVENKMELMRYRLNYWLLINKTFTIP